MGEVSEEQKNEWKRIFDEHDTDEKEGLSRDEVKQVMCCCNQNPTDKEVDEMMTAMDKNSDEKVSFEEFCTFMQQLPDPAESMKEALEVFEGQDGKLTREKLKEILSTDDDDVVEEVLNAADINNDGFIDKEEFIKFIQN
ncbi:uncharacterized protein LOC123545057 [Mercenaria mercenaria]|uniref:uncharacterized protein LOC123545057 n=1 Tax=Mercenaria mercenaria TaxID=6596 RepID=UPI00234E7323|nr:uncharacterized protein LOC123545057 [Mercenaria mercenaria]